MRSHRLPGAGTQMSPRLGKLCSPISNETIDLGRCFFCDRVEKTIARVTRERGIARLGPCVRQDACNVSGHTQWRFDIFPFACGANCAAIPLRASDGELLLFDAPVGSRLRYRCAGCCWIEGPDSGLDFRIIADALDTIRGLICLGLWERQHHVAIMAHPIRSTEMLFQFQGHMIPVSGEGIPFWKLMSGETFRVARRANTPLFLESIVALGHCHSGVLEGHDVNHIIL